MTLVHLVIIGEGNSRRGLNFLYANYVQDSPSFLENSLLSEFPLSAHSNTATFHSLKFHLFLPGTGIAPE